MTGALVKSIRVHPLGLDDAVREAERLIASAERGYVCFANVHLVELAKRDDGVRRALAGGHMVLPDGAPVAWYLCRRLRRKVVRVSGSDFFDAICAVESRRLRHYFLGSTPEVLARLSRAVATRHPNLDVVGTLSPPFRPTTLTEDIEIVRKINSAKPDVVWVGLGAPKQELWMARHRAELEAPLLAGVGAVFDFVSGTKERAPEWMQRRGLEWTHRLISEPRRLAGRYVTTNTSFAASFGGELLRDRLAYARRR